MTLTEYKTYPHAADIDEAAFAVYEPMCAALVERKLAALIGQWRLRKPECYSAEERACIADALAMQITLYHREGGRGAVRGVRLESYAENYDKPTERCDAVTVILCRGFVASSWV